MFLDLNAENVIDAKEIMRGNLIGRGAFGFVFKATLHKNAQESRSIAMKMLQPVQPGIRTGKVPIKLNNSIQIFQVFNSISYNFDEFFRVIW